MEPRDYQKKNIDEILEKFREKDRVLYTLPTGGGKTYSFAFLAREFRKMTGKRILLLCHREELIDQSVATFKEVGMTMQRIVPGTKKIFTFVDGYCAMIETLDRRIKKNQSYITDIGLIIVDECHVQVFQKVFLFFTGAKILGVTATPVLMGRESFFRCKYCGEEADSVFDCCNGEAMEWTRPKKLSKTYQDIIVGPAIPDLIEKGNLVPEISFVRENNTEGLNIDSSGDYAAAALDYIFGSEDAMFNCLVNYKEICKGKRTLIFNPSTKVNKDVYDMFRDAGVNVKMYDSVNNFGESRRQIVDWFRETPDAVLCNVATFVAGLDVREIECVMLNLATKSLSKFIQIVGRGSRPSNRIFKDRFLVIDGGDNIAEFGEWSAERDWEEIFWNGIGDEKAKKEDITDVRCCGGCGGLIPKVQTECCLCGLVELMSGRTGIDKKTPELSTSVLRPIRAIPPPNGHKILEYTRSCGEGFNFALKTLYGQVLDMFIYYRVSRAKYEKAKETGKLDTKITELVRPVYFVLIKSDLEGANRKLDYVLSKARERVDRYYQRG